MIGTFTTPTTANTALARSARCVSSSPARKPIYPRYRKSRMSSEVKRGSHSQYVPHIGWPHSAPVTSAAKVNEAPIGAQLAATACATLMRQMSPAAVGLIWRIKVAHAVAASCAPIGASFTFAALVTGALWGQPMWGTYWEWDPRLTSELILLFLYLGYMGLRAGLEDTQRADRSSAVLAVVGVVNVPIIHYSVTWWNSLHQAPSVMRLAKPTMAASMLVPLLMMLLGFTLFFGAVLLVRLRGEVLNRERSASWIREIVST